MIYQLKPSTNGILLSQLLQEVDINFPLPCSGKGTCGKCKVKIIKGDLSNIEEVEKDFLSDFEIEDGYRLACFAKVYSDLTISIDAEKIEILEEGLYKERVFNPSIKSKEYAIAVDIGTTTVVISLLKGNSAKIIYTNSQVNKQAKFGADIISRIDYSIDNSVGAVHTVIVNQINEMIKDICYKVGISIKDIKYAVVTGNTVMLHFFLNLSPKGMALYPFTPESLFGYNIENNIGLNINNDGKIYLPPCISAYIGADLLCSILAGDLIGKDETALIVDIGTNGEMAIYNNGSIICCSTSAGPAFEGVGIECGSPAVDGAISKVYIDSETNSIKYKTVNNKEPISICGSGIIDIISLFLEHGIIDNTGKIHEDDHDFVDYIYSLNDQLTFKFNNSNIYITQKDIRQIQLAKGSIIAGINTLLQESDINLEAINALYICGGFGSYLNLDSAKKIGLIPFINEGKTIVLGNAAIAGALAIITDTNNIGVCKEIKEKCSFIELSTNSFFMDEFIKYMSFD